jgi:hypothetical protein
MRSPSRRPVAPARPSLISPWSGAQRLLPRREAEKIPRRWLREERRPSPDPPERPSSPTRDGARPLLHLDGARPLLSFSLPAVAAAGRMLQVQAREGGGLRGPNDCPMKELRHPTPDSKEARGRRLFGVLLQDAAAGHFTGKGDGKKIQEGIAYPGAGGLTRF